MIDMKAEAAAAKLLATFVVRESMFAFDASEVQEVIRVDSVTPVWHAPEEVAGVINLRGRIVTLLDLGMILGFGRSAITRESRIFIIEDRDEFLGAIVDKVCEVIEVQEEERHALPVNVPAAQARFFQDIYRSGGNVIAQLNPGEVLSENRL